MTASNYILLIILASPFITLLIFVIFNSSVFKRSGMSSYDTPLASRIMTLADMYRRKGNYVSSGIISAHNQRHGKSKLTQKRVDYILKKTDHY